LKIIFELIIFFLNEAVTHELAHVLGGISSLKTTSQSSITSRYTHFPASPSPQLPVFFGLEVLEAIIWKHRRRGEKTKRRIKKTEEGTEAELSRSDEQNSEVIGFDCCQLEPHSRVTIGCFQYE
jgi:hypothetical protein